MEFVRAFEEAGQPGRRPAWRAWRSSCSTTRAFKDMCERGLSMQLKRTKDGATAETRIAELAGLSARPGVYSTLHLTFPCTPVPHASTSHVRMTLMQGS